MAGSPEEWTSKFRALTSTMKDQYTEITQKVANSSDPVREAKGVFTDVFSKIYGKAESVVHDQGPKIAAMKDHARAFSDSATKTAQGHASAFGEKVAHMQNTGQIPFDVITPYRDTKDAVKTSVREIGHAIRHTEAFQYARRLVDPSPMDRLRSFMHNRFFEAFKEYMVDTRQAISTAIVTALEADPKFNFYLSVLIAVGPKVLIPPITLYGLAFRALGVKPIGGRTRSSTEQTNVPIDTYLTALIQSVDDMYSDLTYAMPFRSGIVLRLSALCCAVYIWNTML